MEWKTKKLGDLAQINYGYTAKASFEINGPKFLRITDIQDGFVNWSTVPSCELSDKDLIKHKLETDDIVFARTGATTGKSFLIKEVKNSVAASYLIRLRLISEEILPEFVYVFFQTKKYWDLVEAGSTGSAQGGFNASKLSNLDINFPSIPEQKRIVALLDTVFADLEQTRAKTEQNLKNARELFESKKLNLFESLGESSNLSSLPLVCDDIFAGGDAPKKGLFSKEQTKEFNIPIYANAVKNNGLYGFTDYSRADEPSITIAARGSGTGHIELRKEPFLPIVRLIVLTPNKEIIGLEYLKYALQTLDILRSGSAIPQLTVPMIKEYSIPVPDMITQEKIVSELQSLKRYIDKIEAIYRKKILNIDELKKSILQKAFSGELTHDKASV